MRIACLVTQYPPRITAGLGRYVEAIAPHLARDHELTIYTLNDGRLPRHERAGTLTVHRPLGRLLGAAMRRGGSPRWRFALLAVNILVSNWWYVRRLRRERPDLVVVHDATNFLGGLLCHYWLRLPVVFHLHTTEHGVDPRRRIAGVGRVLAAVERWLGRIARKVVVATPELREQLAGAGWDRATIEVVCLGGTFERVLADPGFDPDRLATEAAALRTRLGIAPADPVLLYVGRLVRHKGIYQLLAAMPQVTAQVPGLRLVLVGEGDQAGVARIVAETGLTGQVLTSGGFVDGAALLAYYRLADACVFPSLYEPFGLVATESMALGRPTILGAGFSRIFLGDDPARPAVWFVDGTEPGDVAKAVTTVMGDPRLREELGERGRRLVEERLSWARAAGETAALYQAVLPGRT